MFDQNASLAEKAKMETYLKEKILESFNIFIQPDKKGYVDKKEIPYIMRYLGKFPSEAQVSKIILPAIEEDEPSDYIRYSKFEPYMLSILKTDEFDPDDIEIMMAAFKIIDQENKGYIELEYMKELLEKHGIGFRESEMKSFAEFATHNDPNATVFYYEDYLLRLQSFVQKHLDSVMKGFKH
ncbi:hypothetical protein pb186bvf_003501 [Paramecium bursaria]